MRFLISRSKPFITDNTVINTATPSVSPIVEIKEIKEIKPFLRYVDARLEESNREYTYRFFISESLRLAPQNQYISKSLAEVYIYGFDKEDTRSGDEIVEDILLRGDLTLED